MTRRVGLTNNGIARAIGSYQAALSGHALLTTLDVAPSHLARLPPDSIAQARWMLVVVGAYLISTLFLGVLATRRRPVGVAWLALLQVFQIPCGDVGTWYICFAVGLSVGPEIAGGSLSWFARFGVKAEVGMATGAAATGLNVAAIVLCFVLLRTARSARREYRDAEPYPPRPPNN